MANPGRAPRDHSSPGRRSGELDVGLRDITRTGILAAVAEYDKLGQDEFLRRYGFDRACSYPLRRLGFALETCVW